MAKFKLDTSAFANAANSAKTLADELENVILDCSNEVNLAYSDWSGETRNEFEKKYKIFDSQATDIKNGLWDLYEDLVAAEESYIQADTDIAKKLGGVSEGNISLKDY